MQFETSKTYLYHSGWTNGRVVKYIITKRTNKSCALNGRRYKIHVSNGNETIHIGRHANHHILDARDFVGADTNYVKELTRIDHLNQTTNRLVDY